MICSPISPMQKLKLRQGKWLPDSLPVRDTAKTLSHSHPPLHPLLSQLTQLSPPPQPRQAIVRLPDYVCVCMCKPNFSFKRCLSDIQIKKCKGHKYSQGTHSCSLNSDKKQNVSSTPENPFLILSNHPGWTQLWFLTPQISLFWSFIYMKSYSIYTSMAGSFCSTHCQWDSSLWLCLAVECSLSLLY